MINTNDKEGVTSIIYFPLGQDVKAISKAIFSLLDEGWKFNELTVTEISLRRIWEVEFGEQQIEERKNEV